MAKRNITLHEVKILIEEGVHQVKKEPHGWIFHHFPERKDNLICAAVVNNEAI